MNPNPESEKMCIVLTNLNMDSDSVNPAWFSFHLRRDVDDEC